MARIVTVSVQGRAGLPASRVAELEALAEVCHLRRGAPMTPDDARRSLADAEVVALTPKVAPAFDTALLGSLPSLRGLAVYATGLDFLDLPLLGAAGVTVRNLPDYSTVSVAEHTLGLLLTLSRRIHLGHDRSRRLVPETTSLRGFELSGRTLGVVGIGRIGSQVASYARALGMRVVAVDPRTPCQDVPLLGLPDLLRTADAVTLHCSTTLGAAPLIGWRELALLRPGAVLVNASRASLVDSRAVAAAIRAGDLRGYAVDDVVFGPEDDDLLSEGRIVQTGHSAWWSDEVLERGAALWLQATADLARAMLPPRLQEAS